MCIRDSPRTRLLMETIGKKTDLEGHTVPIFAGKPSGDSKMDLGKRFSPISAGHACSGCVLGETKFRDMNFVIYPEMNDLGKIWPAFVTFFLVVVAEEHELVFNYICSRRAFFLMSLRLRMNMVVS